MFFLKIPNDDVLIVTEAEFSESFNSESMTDISNSFKVVSSYTP